MPTRESVCQGPTLDRFVCVIASSQPVLGRITVSQFYKNLALWLVIGLIMIALFNVFSRPQRPTREISFSEFLDQVTEGQVQEVTIQGDDIRGVYRSGTSFRTFAPKDPELIPTLRKQGVRIQAEPPEKTSWYVNLFISWFPMLLLLGVWIFFMRQMQSGGSKALSFGKSRAKLMSDKGRKVTFKDVAGVDEAKEEVVEIIDFLKDPQKFQHLGGKIPKGVLLVGPPGTGKTLLARAIAGEANVPFFSISGSDFVEMDGFESNDGVILIAATNRPDVLDPALLRPGRFDRQIVVPRPDVRGREEILRVHSRNIPLSTDVELSVVARGTPGFSGADLSNLVNEAALRAARLNKKVVDMGDFEQAKDKVIMGAERRSMIISDAEKKITAFHEAGHTLVAKLLPGSDPVHKVTIIPRGLALGLTQQLPVDDRHTYPKEYLLNNLSIMMGGRAAEEIVFKQITTGAGNDIERATELARKMVCEWGMSERMGPLAFGKKEEQIFLGREIAQHRDYSELTAQAIDAEVNRLVMENYQRSKDLLQRHIDKLYLLAEGLLEREVLDGPEIEAIVNNGNNSGASDHATAVTTEDRTHGC